MATDSEAGDPRWPKQLYEQGDEPDPRFTLANERTFLAWIRTALALMAGGVGIEALNVVTEHPNPLRTALAVMLLLAGVLCSATAFARWMSTERALRQGRPLPAPRLAPVLGYGLGVIGVTACVLLFVTGI
ncbi:YidH family protein [Saccharopolyspora sp. NPDC002376]